MREACGSLARNTGTSWRYCSGWQLEVLFPALSDLGERKSIRVKAAPFPMANASYLGSRYGVTCIHYGVTTVALGVLA